VDNTTRVASHEALFSGSSNVLEAFWARGSFLDLTAFLEIPLLERQVGPKKFTATDSFPASDLNSAYTLYTKHVARSSVKRRFQRKRLKPERAKRCDGLPPPCLGGACLIRHMAAFNKKHEETWALRLKH